MAAKPEITIQNLFSDLQRHTQQGAYEKALQVSNKILQARSDDQKAFHCKVVCLIHLGKFEDSLTAIRKNANLASNLSFEKGYCEYRLNRTNEALRTLNSVQQPDNRIKELKAQVLYRLEEYEQCYSIYRDLLKNTQDDFDSERETNLSAVIAALQTWGDSNLDEFGLSEDAYEVTYNHGCFLLGKHLYAEGLDKLKQAEAECVKFFEDDSDATEEDIDAELAVIRVQQGFALQKLGKSDEALKLYNQVMKTRPTEAALLAVVSNNIVTLNKDQNVFDSKKKMKSATVGGLQQKLTSEQRETIAVNQCLLYMYSNQGEQCKKTAEALQKTYPNNHTPALIHAAQLSKDKIYNKAVDILQGQVNNSPGNAVSVKLSLAQLYLSQNHVNQACDLLKALGEYSYKPGVVSALVSLYISLEDKDAASGVLSDAVNWYQQNQPDSAICVSMIRANANFQLRHGDPQTAAEMLEKLTKRDPKDTQALAQLIAAYSKFDQKKAQLLSKKLPSPKEIAAELDVNTLENSVTSFVPKYVKKPGKSTMSPTATQSPKSGDELLEKKKKKKNKKGKLPQDLDRPMDPERWLPLKERSTYRGKKKRGANKRSDVGKGTQGSVPAALMAELDANKPSQPASATPTGESPRPGVGVPPTGGAAASGAPPGPRQSQPKGAKTKKKKGKGGKW